MNNKKPKFIKISLKQLERFENKAFGKALKKSEPAEKRVKKLNTELLLRIQAGPKDFKFAENLTTHLGSQMFGKSPFEAKASRSAIQITDIRKLVKRIKAIYELYGDEVYMDEWKGIPMLSNPLEPFKKRFLEMGYSEAQFKKILKSIKK